MCGTLVHVLYSGVSDQCSYYNIILINRVILVSSNPLNDPIVSVSLIVQYPGWFQERVE